MYKQSIHIYIYIFYNIDICYYMTSRYGNILTLDIRYLLIKKYIAQKKLNIVYYSLSIQRLRYNSQ